MNEAGDLDLAKSAASGDAAAQERIVRDHYEGIHRLARHLIGNHTEAQDLAQQTFINGFRNIGRFDGRASLRAWLAGILVHECSHWRRSRRLLHQIRERIMPDPTNQMVDREMLLGAIHRLSKSHSETFLLVEVHGLSVSETALALGVPEGTIKSRLSEARIRLRRLLGGPEPASREVTNEL